jgi:hypothetical protein
MDNVVFNYLNVVRIGALMNNSIVKGTGKGKVYPITGHEAQRVSRCIALLFIQPQYWMGVGGQRHALAVYPRERPGTHCIGGWIGPRFGLYGCGKSRQHRVSIPGPSSPLRIALPPELSRPTLIRIVWLKRGGPCAETRFRLSEERTSPFESAGVSA